MDNPKPVRVRLAPSPTGEVHIGTIWIALFNWLYAKQQNGSFIVRIEDTDQKRLVAGSAERIFEALEWIGLQPDEGPHRGGEYGPYIQSERLSLYQQYASQLVERNQAYYCFCDEQRLKELRESQQAAKQPTRYDRRCAALAPDVVAQRRAAGEPAVIRLLMPTTGIAHHQDIIRGAVELRYDLQDDSVLLKSDGFPTYHLAVVVDDHLMEISHVIRAEEWLPSIAKHLYLYECFGWEAPKFAHLPLILGTDRSKLSKRHGATSALAFRDQGYVAAAMTNFLALMGWHPKGDNEILTREELLQQFRLEDINPSGAIFDTTKLDWFNGYYIRHLELEMLLAAIRPFWKQLQLEPIDDLMAQQILSIVRDRMRRLSEIDELSETLFPKRWTELAADFDRSLLQPKKSLVDPKESLAWIGEWLQRQTDWSASALKESGLAAIREAGKKNGDVLWPVRVALSLRTQSPDVFDLMAVLGRDESQRRIAFFA